MLSGQVGLDVFRAYRVTPAELDLVDHQAMRPGHLSAESREVAVLKAEDAVARTQRVDQRRLPATGAASRKKDRLPALRLEDRTQVLPQLTNECRHLWTAVVRHRAVHGAKHPLRDIRRSRNLEEVAAGQELLSQRDQTPMMSRHFALTSVRPEVSWSTVTRTVVSLSTERPPAPGTSVRMGGWYVSAMTCDISLEKLKFWKSLAALG